MGDLWEKVPCKCSNSCEGISFLGFSNIWIEESYDSKSELLFQNILFSSIKNTQYGQLRIFAAEDDLAGSFSVFSPITDGNSGNFVLLEHGKEISTLFNLIAEKIRSVQKTVQGRSPSLYEFRKKIGYPVDEYCLVALNINVAELSAEEISTLTLLLKRGPQHGISFLIKSGSSINLEPTSSSSSKRIISIPIIAGNTHVIDPNTLKRIGDANCTLDITIHTSSEIQNEIENLKDDFLNFNIPIVDYGDISPSNYWEKDSTHGIEVTIGRAGQNVFRFNLGDEIKQQHNALVTGAVGQGKTNLLYIIIHDICTNYSIFEVQLWLIDFKEGISLKPLTKINDNSHLPHAKVIGVECDEIYGEIILDKLFEEYRERLALFRENDLMDYKSARLAGFRIPRIVVIIDEFQLLFSNLKQENRITRKFEKYIRLFRAAGIHFILCSQSIRSTGGLLTASSVFYSQIPIRLALRNSAEESQLSLEAGNLGAFHIRPREVIINSNYGEVSNNHRAIVAYAKNEYLRNLRRNFNKLLDQRFEPIIVSKSAAISPKNFIQRNSVGIAIGEYLQLDRQQLTVQIKPYFGENIAIFGSAVSMRSTGHSEIEGMIAILASNGHYKDYTISYCDYTYQGENFLNDKRDLTELVNDGELSIEYINPKFLDDHIITSLQEDSKRFIFVAGLDNYIGTDSLLETSPISRLAAEGPQKGIHLIGHWENYSRFTSQLNNRGSGTNFFNHHIVLNKNNFLSLFIGLPEAGLNDHYPVYVNKNIQEAPIRFVPFGEI